MTHKYLIKIVFLVSLTCFNACSFTQMKEWLFAINSDGQSLEQENETETNIKPDSINESGFRQLHTKDNNKKIESCYNGWGGGVYETPKKGGFIKSIRIVKDCKGDNYALSLDSDANVAVWNLETGQKRQMFTLPEKPIVSTFSNDGRYIAIAKGSKIFILPIMAGTDGPFELGRLSSNVVSLAFDPSSRAIMIGSTDSKVYRWEFNPLQPLKGGRKESKGLERYHQHASVISALAFHPFGRLFFSGDWDGNLNAWLVYSADAYRGEYEENLFGTRFFAVMPKTKSASRRDSERIERIRVSANGQYLAVGAQDGQLELWQVRGLQKLASISVEGGMIYDVAISPSGNRIATIARDGLLKIWEKTRKNERLEAYELVLIDQQEFSDVRVLNFLTEDIVVAGDLSGKVFTINVRKQSFIQDSDDEIIEEIY